MRSYSWSDSQVTVGGTSGHCVPKTDLGILLLGIAVCWRSTDDPRTLNAQNLVMTGCAAALPGYPENPRRLPQGWHTLWAGSESTSLLPNSLWVAGLALPRTRL